MNFYGEMICNHCQKANKVFLEGEGTEETLVLEGDPVPNLKKELKEEFECDYCRHTFVAHPIIEENRFQGLVNDVQFRAYKNGEFSMKRKKENDGIKKEKQKNMVQFHVRFVTPFQSQPYEVGKQLQIQKGLWRITGSWKKENVEEKAELRLEQDIYTQYWYEVKNEKTNETKWLIISDVSGDNSVLMLEEPVLMEYEAVVEIDGEDGKDVLLYEQQVQDRMKIKIYQQKTGVRCLVYEKEEDENDNQHMVISADLFDHSFEDLQKKLETVLEEMNV